MKRIYKIIACIVALALCLAYLPLFATAEVVTFDDINVIESEDFSSSTDKLSNASNITNGVLTVENGKNVRVTDNWWPEGNKPTKISFDLKYTSGKGYFILADAKGNGVGNSVWDNDNGLFSKRAKMVSGAVDEDGDGWEGNKFCGRDWVTTTNSNYAAIKPYENAHYEYEFSYSTTNVTITLKITGVVQDGYDDNVAESTKSFKISDYSLDITTLTPTFITTGSMQLDNLEIESYAVAAKQFVAENTVLNKPVESLTVSDTDTVKALYNTYEKMDENVKIVLEKANVGEFIAAQKEKVDKLNAEIDANAYRQEYDDVLSILTSNMTDEDIAFFAKAMSAYEKLSDYAKQNLTAEKALIEAKGDFVIDNMADFTSADYEDPWYTDKYVKTSGKAEYVFEETEDGINNYVTLGANSSVGVNSKYWTNGNKPANASASFRFGTGTGTLYFLYDEENAIGAGINFHIQDGGYFLRATASSGITYSPNDNSAKLATVVKEKSWVNDESARLGNWQRNMWTKVDATFDYTNWESKHEVTVSYIVTLYGYQYYTEESGYNEESTDTEIKQITLPVKKITYTFPESKGLTLSPKISANYAGVDVDNVTVSGVYSNSQDMGKLFEAKYSSLLEKSSPEELTEAEKLLLESATEDWSKLDTKAREYLVSSGAAAKLSALMSDNDTTTAFKAKYASLEALDTADVRPSHSELVEAAIAEYGTLDDISALILLNFYSHLLELRQAIDNYVEPRPDGDYTTKFIDKFTSGSLKQWTKFTKDTNKVTGTENIEVVEDPTDSSNKVLKVSANGGYITIRDELWPSGGVMTNVTFRFKTTGSTLEGNAFNPTVFYPSFIDVNNATSIAVNATGTMVISGTMEDGDSTGNSGWMGSIDGTGLNAADWITISINYDGINASITYTDEHENKLSAKFGMPLEYGRLAFGSGPNHVWKSVDYYIDDVEISFKKGDYDENVAPNDIQVYYSGNTEMNPGDMVTVTGENLGKTVSGIEIMQLDDVRDASNASYIGEQSFQSKAAEGGATPTWNDSLAQTLEIKQKTATSVKFVIPETFSKGVYAVKLKATYKGAISNITGLTVDDVIIYINNPYIQFTVSDEGKTATPGGWIRAQGSNVALVQDVTKLSAVITNGTYTRTLGITELYDDEYSVKISVPKDVPYGTYNLMVYNGYGDNTAWSEPAEITVGASPRDSWSTTVFNVQDEKYGAKGDSTTNDTAAIISALIDAAENGGGVVYLPRGIYRVTNTLTIPENVVFKGDGIENTKIIYTPTNWMMGDAPNAYVQFTSNVAIENMAFYGVRHKHIFSIIANKTVSGTKMTSENVYIKNVYLHLQETTGATTEGDSTPIKGIGYTKAEMLADINAERSKSESGANTAYISADNVVNGHVINFTNWMALGCNMGINGNWQYSRYDNVEFRNWSGFTTSKALIVENCRNNEQGGCLGISGEVYVKNFDFNGHSSNNHEITTTDGTHPLDGATMQFIGDNEAIMGAGKTNEVTFRIKGRAYKEGALVGSDVYILTGQGLGQTRRIVANKESDITLDKPFAVRPNRNSLIAIQTARSNGFFIDNSYEKGGAAGTYGSIINTVFDGNTYKEFGGQIFNTHEGVNWYTSIVNAKLDDPFYMHGQGLGGTAQGQTNWGHWQFLLLHGLRPLSSMAFLFKGNTLNGGSYMQVNSNYNYCRDFVIEKNHFGENAKCGVYFNGGSDGIYLRGNTFDSDVCYDSTLISNLNTQNEVVNILGDYRYKSEDDYLRTGGTKMGDVNGDGKINIKDVTYIRYYILGKIELSNAQIARADMDGDGEITTNDANKLRKLILGL